MTNKINMNSILLPDATKLPDDVKNLMKAAEQQLNFAYAPYSNFHVGAAILLESKEIYTGCNQENASYPLCICAERVALYNVGTNHKEFKIKALAITAHNPKKALLEPVMPCGACRQVIQEFESRQNAPITMYLTSDCPEIMKIEGISEILPCSFSKDHLI